MSRPLPHLARREDFDDLAGRAFVARAERERDRVEKVTAASTVDAMLRALAALAACGVINWKSASLRVRAIFSLHSLIGAFRS